jgi:hypothetical protein
MDWVDLMSQLSGVFRLLMSCFLGQLMMGSISPHPQAHRLIPSTIYRRRLVLYKCYYNFLH